MLATQIYKGQTTCTLSIADDLPTAKLICVSAARDHNVTSVSVALNGTTLTPIATLADANDYSGQSTMIVACDGLSAGDVVVATIGTGFACVTTICIFS